MLQDASSSDETSDDPSDETTTGEAATTDLNDLKSLESLLKLSGSLTLEYVPGSDYKTEEMKFTWNLLRFDETGIELDIVFDNPDSVSSYA